MASNRHRIRKDDVQADPIVEAGKADNEVVVEVTRPLSLACSLSKVPPFRAAAASFLRPEHPACRSTRLRGAAKNPPTNFVGSRPTRLPEWRVSPLLGETPTGKTD